MERAILVIPHHKGKSAGEVQARAEELAGLVAAAGGEVAGWSGQAREKPETGMGKGALEQLCQRLRDENATLAVVDQELSPGILSRMEQGLGEGIRVVDRTQIILDIFALRARTREARVQVELAQYRYLEPRLKGRGRWSRQGGGIGTRGPGETGLEVERRHVRRRIGELAEELKAIERQRAGRRQRRLATELPLVALVGYTNVGKSTLYGALTGYGQVAHDSLFVTLDTKVRRILVPQFGWALMVDTVGFVDRLPHPLVAAFRSTLAEVRDADLLLEVVSADPSFPIPIAEQRRVIDQTLADLDVSRIPRLLVYNQWDRVADQTFYPQSGSVKVSALYGQGMENLRQSLGVRLAESASTETLTVAWDQAGAWRVVYREMAIVSRRDFKDGAELVLRGSGRAFHLLHQALGTSGYALKR